MKRFILTAGLFCLASLNLQAQQPAPSAPPAYPLRASFQRTAEITRQTIHIPGAGSPTYPVAGVGRAAVQTTARVLAFPFVGSYVVATDAAEALSERARR